MVYTVYDFSHDIAEILVAIINWVNNGLGWHGWADWWASFNTMHILSLLIQTIVIFAVSFMLCLTMIWMERKVLGRMMDRRATQVGPLGYLCNFADGLKTFGKQIIIPQGVDDMVYTWSTALLIGISVLCAGAVPISDQIFLLNYDVGVLFIFGLFCLPPLMILIAGWAGNCKYSVMGGLRAATQMISYEIPMLLCIVAVVLAAGTWTFVGLTEFQAEHGWFILPMFIGFITFFVAAIAESERTPFDLPEAEAELVEGWQTEIGGMRWGLVMLGDYFRGYVTIAMMVYLFLGGFAGPDILPGFVWYLAKVFIIWFIYIWIRASLVRVTTDIIINLGWRRLFPLSIINLIFVIAAKYWGWFGW